VGETGRCPVAGAANILFSATPAADIISDRYLNYRSRPRQVSQTGKSTDVLLSYREEKFPATNILHTCPDYLILKMFRGAGKSSCAFFLTGSLLALPSFDKIVCAAHPGQSHQPFFHLQEVI